LLDEPRASSFPQLEFVYLFLQVKVGGWIVLDDRPTPAAYARF
jgi:hypothetical protein